MRVPCLIAVFLVSLPVQADVWECKPPIEQIPWSAIELIAEATENGEALVRIGNRTYGAEYELDGTTNTWLIDQEPTAELQSGVLRIKSNGDGIMWREHRHSNGTVSHIESTYHCRKADAAS